MKKYIASFAFVLAAPSVSVAGEPATDTTGTPGPPAAPTADTTAVAIGASTSDPAGVDQPGDTTTAKRDATSVVASPVDEAALDKLIDERIAKQKPTAGWKDGFFVQSPNGAAKLKLGGFTQFDGRFFVGEAATDPKVDQFGFRSIRPDLQGTIFEHFDFRLLPDFAGAKLVLQDVYADVHYTDKVKVRFGKFKVPFGLERLQAETATTFVERGLPTQLAPNRDLGVQVFGEVLDDRLAYQVGVFNGVADGQSGDADASSKKEVAARVFVKPAFGIGVGGAVTYGYKKGTLASPDVAGFKTQGQTTFFTYAAGATLPETVIADGKHWRATAQADWYYGPIGVLAEYVRSTQHVALDATHGNVEFAAWQGVVQWVVTGEDATFKSVSPTHEYGAIDVAARVGQLRSIDTEGFDKHFADVAKSANRATSAGLGADWFPNKNIRFALDFERTTYRGGAKDMADRPTETSIVGRVQTVF